MVEQWTENPCVRSSILRLGTSFRPKWRNRQTRQSQKLLGGDSRVGSIPTFGTSSSRWGMKRGLLRGFLLGAFIVAGVVGVRLLLRKKHLQPVGSFLGVPYDLRWPKWDVVKERLWNPDDPRVLTPHVFGWGWSVNLYALGRRLGLLP